MSNSVSQNSQNVNFPQEYREKVSKRLFDPILKKKGNYTKFVIDGLLKDAGTLTEQVVPKLISAIEGQLKKSPKKSLSDALQKALDHLERIDGLNKLGKPTVQGLKKLQVLLLKARKHEQELAKGSITEQSITRDQDDYHKKMAEFCYANGVTEEGDKIDNFKDFKDRRRDAITSLFQQVMVIVEKAGAHFVDLGYQGTLALKNTFLPKEIKLSFVFRLLKNAGLWWVPKINEKWESVKSDFSEYEKTTSREGLERDGHKKFRYAIGKKDWVVLSKKTVGDFREIGGSGVLRFVDEYLENDELLPVRSLFSKKEREELTEQFTKFTSNGIDKLFDEHFDGLSDKLNGQLQSELSIELFNQLSAELNDEHFDGLSKDLSEKLKNALSKKSCDGLSKDLKRQMQSELSIELFNKLSSEVNRGKLFKKRFFEKLKDVLSKESFGELSTELSQTLFDKLQKEIFAKKNIKNVLNKQIEAQITDRINGIFTTKVKIACDVAMLAVLIFGVIGCPRALPIRATNWIQRFSYVAFVAKVAATAAAIGISSSYFGLRTGATQKSFHLLTGRAWENITQKSIVQNCVNSARLLFETPAFMLLLDTVKKELGVLESFLDNPYSELEKEFILKLQDNVSTVNYLKNHPFISKRIKGEQKTKIRNLLTQRNLLDPQKRLKEIKEIEKIIEQSRHNSNLRAEKIERSIQTLRAIMATFVKIAVQMGHVIVSPLWQQLVAEPNEKFSKTIMGRMTHTLLSLVRLDRLIEGTIKSQIWWEGKVIGEFRKVYPTNLDVVGEVISKAKLGTVAERKVAQNCITALKILKKDSDKDLSEKSLKIKLKAQEDGELDETTKRKLKILKKDSDKDLSKKSLNVAKKHLSNLGKLFYKNKVLENPLRELESVSNWCELTVQLFGAFVEKTVQNNFSKTVEEQQLQELEKTYLYLNQKDNKIILNKGWDSTDKLSKKELKKFIKLVDVGAQFSLRLKIWDLETQKELNGLSRLKESGKNLLILKKSFNAIKLELGKENFTKEVLERKTEGLLNFLSKDLKELRSFVNSEMLDPNETSHAEIIKAYESLIKELTSLNENIEDLQYGDTRECFLNTVENELSKPFQDIVNFKKACEENKKLDKEIKGYKEYLKGLSSSFARVRSDSEIKINLGVMKSSIFPYYHLYRRESEVEKIFKKNSFNHLIAELKKVEDFVPVGKLAIFTNQLKIIALKDRLVTQHWKEMSSWMFNKGSSSKELLQRWFRRDVNRKDSVLFKNLDKLIEEKYELLAKPYTEELTKTVTKKIPVKKVLSHTVTGLNVVGEVVDNTLNGKYILQGISWMYSKFSLENLK